MQDLLAKLGTRKHTLVLYLVVHFWIGFLEILQPGIVLQVQENNLSAGSFLSIVSHWSKFAPQGVSSSTLLGYITQLLWAFAGKLNPVFDLGPDVVGRARTCMHLVGLGLGLRLHPTGSCNGGHARAALHPKRVRDLWWDSELRWPAGTLS